MEATTIKVRFFCSDFQSIIYSDPNNTIQLRRGERIKLLRVYYKGEFVGEDFCVGANINLPDQLSIIQIGFNGQENNKMKEATLSYVGETTMILSNDVNSMFKITLHKKAQFRGSMVLLFQHQ